MTATARTHYNDSAHKLLSPNREGYFAQSARTVGGVVAQYEPPTQGEVIPAWDEVVTNFADYRGA